MHLLTTTLIRIVPRKHDWAKLAQAKLDNKTKPKGALGRLEEFACQCAAIAGTADPKIGPKVIYTFAADHGVTEETVSACPKEVTAQMVLNLLTGGAGVNVLARHSGATVRVVDIGVDHDFGNLPGLIAKKVARGTRNLARGPAMTREEAISALEVGIELANRAKAEGVAMLGTGEMGIGNTTPASAIIACYSGKSVAAVTHRGTGIGDAALRRKIRVIEQSLALNNPKPDDPIDVLAKVGGLEIAGIAGLILGAAANRIPVIVDGFISTAGALIAHEINPISREYMFAAHKSVEVGHGDMLERIGLEPILDLQFRLGEGTGAALAMGLVEASIRILNEMATFAQAGVTEGTDDVGVLPDAV